jgi:uncharacterized protein (UPF0333 family)
MAMFDKIINSVVWMAGEKAQMIIEYAIVFTVIVVVIIFAANFFIKPSVNKLFQDTSTVINNIADDFVQEMSPQ